MSAKMIMTIVRTRIIPPVVERLAMQLFQILQIALRCGSLLCRASERKRHHGEWKRRRPVLEL